MSGLNHKIEYNSGYTHILRVTISRFPLSAVCEFSLDVFFDRDVFPLTEFKHPVKNIFQSVSHFIFTVTELCSAIAYRASDVEDESSDISHRASEGLHLIGIACLTREKLHLIGKVNALESLTVSVFVERLECGLF